VFTSILARKTVQLLALSFALVAVGGRRVAAMAVEEVTAPRTVFAYSSEAGDYIGQGGSNRYTPDNATISVRGTSQNLTFSVVTTSEFWFVQLAAPSGETLHPGVYYNAERAAFRTGRAPGVDVSGDGRGCNQIWATFEVNQITSDSSGNVTLLDGSFTQQCESPSAPALTGVVRYQALPLAYAFQSDPGDYIGAGGDKRYTNSTSTFAISGDQTSVQYSVSGLRDTWTAIIHAPIGQVLQAGTYDTARFADNSRAGLDVFGDGRGCNQSSGTLTIGSITFNEQGQVTGLKAKFEQHCENGVPALHGTIRHYQ
jgi:hypothetical protein